MRAAAIAAALSYHRERCTHGHLELSLFLQQISCRKLRTVARCEHRIRCLCSPLRRRRLRRGHSYRCRRVRWSCVLAGHEMLDQHLQRPTQHR